MKGALSWRRAGEGIWATPRGAVLGEAAAPVEVRRTEPMPPGTAQPGMVVMGTIRPTLVLAARCVAGYYRGSSWRCSRPPMTAGAGFAYPSGHDSGYWQPRAGQLAEPGR